MRAGLKASVKSRYSEPDSRFRISPGIALKKLEKLKYTIDYVFRHKDRKKFVQEIMILGRSARKVNWEYAQMPNAHPHFAAELQIRIPAFILETTSTTFMVHISRKNDDWFDFYKF